MYQTIIFDVDGTLLDSEKIYMKAWADVGAEFGYPIPQAALLESRAMSAPVAKQIFMKYCGEDFPYDAIQQVRKGLVEQMFASTPPEILRMPHTITTLQTLKEQRFIIAAASSTPYEKTCEHLRHAGIYQYFDVIVCGDMVAKGKPEPDIFLKAAEECNCQSAACIVVGDTPADVLGAVAAGIPVILIPDRVPANEQTIALSRYVLSDLSQLPEKIEQMNNEIRT